MHIPVATPVKRGMVVSSSQTRASFRLVDILCSEFHAVPLQETFSLANKNTQKHKDSLDKFIHSSFLFCNKFLLVCYDIFLVCDAFGLFANCALPLLSKIPEVEDSCKGLVRTRRMLSSIDRSANVWSIRSHLRL